MLEKATRRVTEVAPGILRLRLVRHLLGRPFIHVHAYLLREAGLLVDSGFPVARGEVEAFLAGHRVEAVLTTHHHEDHVGNHDLLAARGIPLHAPPATAHHLRGGVPDVPRYRRVIWGLPRGTPGVEVHEVPGGRARGVDRGRVGDRSFRGLHAPGHAEDHVVYLDEASGVGFSGDVLVPRFRATREVENVPRWIASLRRLRDLDADLLLPGHGPPVRDPDDAIVEEIERLEDLRERARELREAGWSVRRMRRELLGREPPLRYISLGEFSSANLVRSLLEDDEDEARPVG